MLSVAVSELSITDHKRTTASDRIEIRRHDRTRCAVCINNTRASLLCSPKATIGSLHLAGACMLTLMRSVLIAAKPPDLMLSSMSPVKKLDCH